MNFKEPLNKSMSGMQLPETANYFVAPQEYFLRLLIGNLQGAPREYFFRLPIGNLQGAPREYFFRLPIGNLQGAKLWKYSRYSLRFAPRIWLAQEPVCSTRAYSEVP